MRADILRFSVVLTLLVLGAGAAAQSPNLEVTTTLASSYPQGATDAITITVTLAEMAELEQGVLFLNIVEPDPARNYPQVAHKLFASASEEPGIFRTVHSRRALQEGLQTTLSFSLRDSAKPGDYALVVQLFRGDNTNPGRVRVENRVGMATFEFTVEARDN